MASTSKYEQLFKAQASAEAADIQAGAEWLLKIIQEKLDANHFTINRVARQVTVEDEIGSGAIRMSAPYFQQSLDQVAKLLTAAGQPWKEANITTGPAKHEMQTKLTAILTLR